MPLKRERWDANVRKHKVLHQEVQQLKQLKSSPSTSSSAAISHQYICITIMSFFSCNTSTRAAAAAATTTFYCHFLDTLVEPLPETIKHLNLLMITNVWVLFSRWNVVSSVAKDLWWLKWDIFHLNIEWHFSHQVSFSILLKGRWTLMG